MANQSLIQGAGDLARSEARKTSIGGAAFAQGLTGSILTGIEKQEELKTTREAYLADLGSIQNISLLEQGYNKEAVTAFVRNKRDEYAKLADAYARTKDTDILDKMDAIKFSFSNLNQQLQALVNERKGYWDAVDKGQVVDLEGDEIYTQMYTNKGAFTIEANGDIGFGSGQAYNKFKDVAGKWNVKNNIAETFTLEQNLVAKQIGEKGGNFYGDDIKNLYINKFKETGPEGIMVMAKTDLTGDNEYILSNGQKAGNLSFERMWSEGLLDEKFYEQIPKGTDSSWMYKKENIDILNDLVSEYYKDVTEDSYNRGKANYVPGTGGKGGKPANFIIGGQTFNAQDFNNNFVPFVNQLGKMKDGDIKQSPTGLNVTKKDGKYYRVSGMSKGKPILDEDQGAMDLQQLGTFDGWGRFFSFEDPNTTSPLLQDVQQVGAYLGMNKEQIAQQVAEQNKAQAGAADNIY